MKNILNILSVSTLINSKKIIYGSGIILISAFVGSVYYLYNIFKNDVELTEEHKMQIEEIKEEIEEMKGEITIEAAIQIVTLITNISDEIFNKNKGDINEKRRACINKPEEYKLYSKETFNLKEKALSEATRKVLYYFGNISYEKIQFLLRKVSQYELESIAYKVNPPSFEENSPPDKSTVKQAYKFYAMRYIEEMELFYEKESKYYKDIIPLNEKSGISIQSIENELFFKLLIIKLKIDDELYLKFKYREEQIRYLLYEYQLFDDNDVRKLYENVNKQLQFINN